MVDKIQIVCSTCGSANVRRDAWAEWQPETQEWVLGSVFDYGDCDVCSGESRLEEVGFDDWYRALNDDHELRGVSFRARQLEGGTYEAELHLADGSSKTIGEELPGWPITIAAVALDCARSAILHREIWRVTASQSRAATMPGPASALKTWRI